MPRSPKIEFISRGLLRRGDLVLICRDRRRGHAYLPGGHVEPGEPAREAARREFLEETGLEIHVGAPLLCWEALFRQQNQSKHELTVVFHVEHNAGDPGKPLAVESLEPQIAFEWIPAARAESERVLPAPVAAWLSSRDLEEPGLDWLSIDEIDSLRGR